MPEHMVYILKCKDDTLYTGYTTDMEHRLKMHKQGKGAKYTRGRGPFQVKFIEKYATKEEAMQREYAIKQMKRKEKLQLISENEKEVTRYENPKEFC